MTGEEKAPSAKEGAAPMSGAGLLATLDMLCLSQRDAGRILGVSDRTVRYWIAGEYVIPDAVARDVRAWVIMTDRCVADMTRLCVADMLAERGTPLWVPRTNRDLWRGVPGSNPWPASWYRAMAARAALRAAGESAHMGHDADPSDIAAPDG